MHATRPLSSSELSLSTEAARRLLESLKLDSYFFSVEPGEDQWELHLECTIEGGWQSLTIPVDHDALQATLNDPELRARTLAEWDQQLCNCKREGERPSAQPVQPVP